MNEQDWLGHQRAYDKSEGVVKLAQLVWDANTLSWVKATQGSGGGGGAVTVTNTYLTVVQSGVFAVSGISSSAGAVSQSGAWAVSLLSPPRGSLTDRSVSVGTSSAQVMAANGSRNYLFIQNISDTAIWINFGTAAVTDSPSIKINPNDIYSPIPCVTTDALNAISTLSGKKLVAKEG